MTTGATTIESSGTGVWSLIGATAFTAVALAGVAFWLLRPAGKIATPAPATDTTTSGYHEGIAPTGGLAGAPADEQAVRMPSPAPPTVFIVASDAAAAAIWIVAGDTDAIRASYGERPIEHRVIVLPAGLDAEVMLAEERRMRDAEGMPQIEVVDLRPLQPVAVETAGTDD